MRTVRQKVSCYGNSINMASDTSSSVLGAGHFSLASSQKASLGAHSSGRLLRKPLLPKVAPKPPPTPPENQYRTIPGEYLIEPEYYYEDNDYNRVFIERSGTSPPPPSEFQANSSRGARGRSETESTRTVRLKSNATRSVHSVPRSKHGTSTQGRYVLDPLYREQTNIGTYVEGQALVQPFKPRGPDGLPARVPNKRLHTQYYQTEDDLVEDAKYIQPPEFTLKDFLYDLSTAENIPIERVQRVIYSRFNYKKIQKILADYLNPKHTTVTKVTMKPPEEMPRVTPRIPQKQLLYEMAALIKDQMSSVLGTEMKPLIRPLPKFSPDYQPGLPNPHTEIVLYDSSNGSTQQQFHPANEAELPGTDNIFNSPTARYFQGSRRSNSPFVPADEEVISPAELAVLDALMSGGLALSLKANFISQLPDIEPIVSTLTYLNISFNDFAYMPYEIFELEHLSILKMRNNPLKEIPNEIAALKNLRTLVFSFCLVTQLPVGLFSLKKLEHLDFAFNRITFIPNEIKQLRRLQELNVEGNQLPAFPMGALRLQRLRHVRVLNNYMHPLFWRDNTRNDAPRLLDMAARIFLLNKLDKIFSHLPDHVTKVLENHSKCDCCRGPRFGAGLRMIRPVPKMFGVKNLPILFVCCSTDCMRRCRHGQEELAELLYGTPSHKQL